MNIEDVKVEKTRLEMLIVDLCEGFRERTGMTVDSLDVRHITVQDMDHHLPNRRVGGVRAKIDLGI